MTEKLEKILEDINKIRHIIYEKFLHEKVEENNKVWKMSSDLFSIKVALQNYPSIDNQEISQFQDFLIDLSEEFNQIEIQQALVKKNLPFQMRKYGMNVHLYNQMLKKRAHLAKYFRSDASSSRNSNCNDFINDGLDLNNGDAEFDVSW